VLSCYALVELLNRLQSLELREKLHALKPKGGIEMMGAGKL
jgi:hypothetical protein